MHLTHTSALEESVTTELATPRLHVEVSAARSVPVAEQDNFRIRLREPKQFGLKSKCNVAYFAWLWATNCDAGQGNSLSTRQELQPIAIGNLVS